ncbi:hypothetical protein WICMUC_001902 [Wickerhamomyces mucosus]|uniref:Mevalonate kinase n=1 Tax=Wickerhamomyces mucosus TaxID=1378264 RepID=A0A9P8PRT6_9ASCO|nr:hypothetical protein WICMUC_001902 [Wickerhamomyces mucosus]
MPELEPFIVSAPGKVIIFGEHSAVYAKPAIAAAISLRTYLMVAPSEDEEDLTLEFPDIGLVHSWKRSSLPWEVVEKFSTSNKPTTTDELIPEVVSEISKLLSDMNQSIHYAASSSFLYLYVHLCNRQTKAKRFTVRSTLPIGSGLGSSATISVCLAGALSILGQHIEPATLGNNDKSVDNQDSEYIDSWAFMGEKLIQGNPSGIDNAVATHGGAVMFQRTQSSVPSVRTTMRNFPKLKLLLTDTKQPRRSSDLVGNVSRLNSEYPKIISSILNALEDIAREGYSIMIKPNLDERARKRLSELFEINHGLLVALGVSHPVLEKVRILTDEFKIGKTKLTGAGGGGCAITLIDDDVAESKIKELIAKYDEFGFETFETSLGGKGVGYLNDLKIDSEGFLSLESKEDIENAIGVDNVNEWKFCKRGGMTMIGVALMTLEAAVSPTAYIAAVLEVPTSSPFSSKTEIPFLISSDLIAKTLTIPALTTAANGTNLPKINFELAEIFFNLGTIEFKPNATPQDAVTAIV